WGTEIPSYVDWIQIPFFRLPGFSEVKKGDAVVFNTPEELDLPVDMRTYLIKRCVGVAGDTISMVDGHLSINGVDTQLPGKRQHAYLIITDQTLRERFFDKYKIIDIAKASVGYQVMTSAEKVAEIKTLDFIKDVVALNDQNERGRFSYNVFPHSEDFNWTFNNFGPLYITKKGETIPLNRKTVSLYGNIIANYEGNENAVINKDFVSIDGKNLSEYTFKQHYYFMMGDNRHNSHDSRAWGFVPMDHVVGKAIFTWFSIENGPTIKLFSRIRWNRIFKSIE
ncbi:MAG: signal peptidase I, partial [Cyclobacteriaceae bacterium]